MGNDETPKKGKAKKPGKKLELNKETVQELNDEQLGDVAGGVAQYNSNGCGTRYSYRGQLTCDPGTTNPIPPQTLG